MLVASDLAFVNLHILFLGVVDREGKQYRNFVFLKMFESGTESVVLSLLTVAAIVEGGVGGSAALFWSSLALSALSMAYGFYGLAAEFKKEQMIGRRLELFACVLVH